MPRTFRVHGDSTADVTAASVEGGVTATVSLPMSSGSLTVQARDDGTLAVTALELDLGHVAIGPESFPPDGLDLEGLALTLGSDVDAAADWSGDASAMNGSATTELLLDWSVATAGATLPLATEHIARVVVALAVSRADDGTVVLDVQASRDGVFWTWADLIDLADLRVSLKAAP